jgi:hypothetical protein
MSFVLLTCSGTRHDLGCILCKILPREWYRMVVSVETSGWTYLTYRIATAVSTQRHRTFDETGSTTTTTTNVGHQITHHFTTLYLLPYYESGRRITVEDLTLLECYAMFISTRAPTFDKSQLLHLRDQEVLTA